MRCFGFKTACANMMLPPSDAPITSARSASPRERSMAARIADVGREARQERLDRFDRPDEERLEDLSDGLAGDGPFAGERLVEDDAERPNVRAMVDVFVAVRLFGRHVMRRAEHRAGLR